MLTMAAEDSMLPSNDVQLDNNNETILSNKEPLPCNDDELSSNSDSLPGNDKEEASNGSNRRDSGFSKLERSETVIHRGNDKHITNDSEIQDDNDVEKEMEEAKDLNKEREEQQKKNGEESQNMEEKDDNEEDRSVDEETEDDEDEHDDSQQESSLGSNSQESDKGKNKEAVNDETVEISAKKSVNTAEQKDFNIEHHTKEVEHVPANGNEDNNQSTNQNSEDIEASNETIKKDEDITSKEELSINDKDDDELKDEKEEIQAAPKSPILSTNQEEKLKLEKDLKEKVNKEVIKNPLQPKIRGCDVNKADKQKVTPLHQIFIKLDESVINDGNDIEIIDLLLELGAEVNAKTSQGHSALHYAVGHNRSVAILQALVNGGAELDITDDKGCTPLYYAIAPLSGNNPSDFEYRNADIAKYLLENGARVDTIGTSGRRTCTALQLAVFCRRLDIVKTMLKNIKYDCNFDVGLPWLHTLVNWNTFSLQTENKLHGLNALFLAVNNQDVAMVRELVQAGASVNALNHDKMSPLHYITKENQGIINSEQIENEKDLLAIASYLIEHGADLNMIDGRTGNGRTPLQYAIVNGHTEIAKLIIEKGQNLDLNLIENENNMSAIFFALSHNKQILNQLIKHPDVDLTLQDNQGKTILHYAVQKEPEVAKTLARTCKMLINMSDKQGKTALHYMALDNEQMVEMLVQRGADVNMEDGRGKTPLHYALFGGNKSIVKYLLKHGGKTPCVTPQASVCIDE